METGRKGRHEERAGPTPLCAVRIWRDSSAVKVPPEECGVSTLAQSMKANKRSPHNFWL